MPTDSLMLDNSVPSATALSDACAWCTQIVSNPVHWVALGATVTINGVVIAAHSFVEARRVNHSACIERERRMWEYVTHKADCDSIRTFCGEPLGGSCTYGLAELLAAKEGE